MGKTDLVKVLWPIRKQNFFPDDDDAMKPWMRHPGGGGLCLWKCKMCSKRLFILLAGASIFCRCEATSASRT